MLLSHHRFVPYFQFAEPMAASGASFAYSFTVLPDDELANAAISLREAEIEAVQTEDDGPEKSEGLGTYDTVCELSSLDVLKSMRLTESDLDSMSIDELRAVANVLDIPNRARSPRSRSWSTRFCDASK